MKNFLAGLVLASTSVLFSEMPAYGADSPPTWAYVWAPDFQVPPADNVLQRLPGSTAAFSWAQARDLFFSPSWHPEDHPAMPEVVARGRKPDVRACGSCHRAEGTGGPENSSLAGLPASYFVQQMADFKRLGVLGDWERPYRTMDYANEAGEIRAFKRVIERGFVYRGLKPVYWCFDCGSSLAEFEIEYADKKSQTLDVGFLCAEPDQLAAAFGKIIKRIGMPGDGLAVPFDAPRSVLNGRVREKRRFATQQFALDRLRAVASAITAAIRASSSPRNVTQASASPRAFSSSITLAKCLSCRLPESCSLPVMRRWMAWVFMRWIRTKKTTRRPPFQGCGEATGRL